MEFADVNNGVRVLLGAVNMGLVMTSDGLTAVDTGLDKQAAKKLIHAAEDLGRPIIAIINTHAHADHFGGNDAVLAKYPQALVYAPVHEAPMIRQPSFEPQYLWQGAQPFSQLQNKFLLAPASRVDNEFHPGEAWQIGETRFEAFGLPGHAHAQCGIRVNGVLFAADSYFGANVTDKHGIPFMVDYHRTLQSAQAAASIAADWWVPGHGDPTRDPSADIEHLINRHQSAYERVIRMVSESSESGISLDDLTGQMCLQFQLKPANPGGWLLIRTTIAAYVSAAIDNREIEPAVEAGILKLRSL
ncbi:MBL fold metallo-hydrolase [Alicyclobacillus ferrooxydans]|uniref:MBL fold metallo-hydrolase n=1 Tax=Alicyclobacillus ferrooxydans TaxID=471514 RepID=UPI0006D53D81|nr:MBL fold metallo-hydrolase [Alicyclobacillus ferrooxydans]